MEKLISQGLSINEIARQLGINPQACRRIIKEKYPDYAPTKTCIELPHDTLQLRMLLGDKLYNIDKSRREKAEICGLNWQEQVRAERRPYSHDWTLSQISRLAAYYEGEFECRLVSKIS